MTRTKLGLLLSGLLLLPFLGYGQMDDTVVVFNDANALLRVDHSVFIYQDSTSRRHIAEVAGFSFKEQVAGTPNLGITNSTIWVKLRLLNSTTDSVLFLSVRQPSIVQIFLYRADRMEEGRV